MNKRSRILLAEDDLNLGFVVQDNLIQHGFEVVLCKDGKEALENFSSDEFDLCILDVMMPKMDGFELVEEIRNQNSDIPILFLTARTMKEDRIRGFTLGGDDYIIKPFSIEELICRINVFIKRSGAPINSIKSEMSIGAYLFDYENLLLKNQSKEFTLTQMEADVLLILYNHAGEVRKRGEILKEIWGDDDYFNGRSLDVFISRLRKLLSDDDTVKIINQHGVGFKLVF